MTYASFICVHLLTRDVYVHLYEHHKKCICTSIYTSHEMYVYTSNSMYVHLKTCMYIAQRCICTSHEMYVYTSCSLCIHDSYIQPTAFGVSFLQSQNSIYYLVLIAFGVSLPRSVGNRPIRLRFENEIKRCPKCNSRSHVTIYM